MNSTPSPCPPCAACIQRGAVGLSECDSKTSLRQPKLRLRNRPRCAGLPLRPSAGGNPAPDPHRLAEEAQRLQLPPLRLPQALLRVLLGAAPVHAGLVQVPRLRQHRRRQHTAERSARPHAQALAACLHAARHGLYRARPARRRSPAGARQHARLPLPQVRLPAEVLPLPRKQRQVRPALPGLSHPRRPITPSATHATMQCRGDPVWQTP